LWPGTWDREEEEYSDDEEDEQWKSCACIWPSTHEDSQGPKWWGLLIFSSGPPCWQLGSRPGTVTKPSSQVIHTSSSIYSTNLSTCTNKATVRKSVGLRSSSLNGNAASQWMTSGLGCFQTQDIDHGTYPNIVNHISVSHHFFIVF
jgi:hypothetical protein